MPAKALSALLCALLLSGCASQLSAIQRLGAEAIESRRRMNDMEARAIMAATCDISVGALFRELSPLERRYVALICGGQPDPDFPIEPERKN